MSNIYLVKTCGIGEEKKHSFVTTPESETHNIMYKASIGTIESMFTAALVLRNVDVSEAFYYKKQIDKSLKKLFYKSWNDSENIFKQETELQAFQEASRNVPKETEYYKLWKNYDDEDLRRKTELVIMQKIIEEWVQKIEFNTFVNFVHNILLAWQQKEGVKKWLQVDYRQATLLCTDADSKTSPMRKEIVEHMFQDDDLAWFYDRIYFYSGSERD